MQVWSCEFRKMFTNFFFLLEHLWWLLLSNIIQNYFNNKMKIQKSVDIIWIYTANNCKEADIKNIYN